jgi:hypothetical protein
MVENHQLAWRKAWAAQPYRDKKRDAGWKQNSEVEERENKQAGVTREPFTPEDHPPKAQGALSTKKENQLMVLS